MSYDDDYDFKNAYKQVFGISIEEAQKEAQKEREKRNQQEEAKRRRELNEEIKPFEEAIKNNPNDINAFFNRALACEQKGFFDEAIDDYNFIISQNPNHIRALCGLGMSYSMKWDFEKAIPFMDKALKIEPQNAMVLYSKAIILLREGNRKKYKNDFSTALTHTELCLSCINEALKIDPNPEPFKTLLSEAKKQKCELVNALQVIKKVQDDMNKNRIFRKLSIILLVIGLIPVLYAFIADVAINEPPKDMTLVESILLLTFAMIIGGLPWFIVPYIILYRVNKWDFWRILATLVTFAEVIGVCIALMVSSEHINISCVVIGMLILLISLFLVTISPKKD